MSGDPSKTGLFPDNGHKTQMALHVKWIRSNDPLTSLHGENRDIFLLSM